MKTRNTLAKTLLLVALIAGLSFVFVNWQTTQVEAIQDSEDHPSDHGFIELVAGQSARLNVVNRQPPPGGTRLPQPDTPIARRVRLLFDVYVEDEENTLCGGIVPEPTCLKRYHFVRRELREVELSPGQAASLNFSAVEGAKVQAFIQSLGGPDTIGPDVTPEPHLIPSLEVREGTRTLFVAPAVIKGFNPQPDPPGQQH